MDSSILMEEVRVHSQMGSREGTWWWSEGRETEDGDPTFRYGRHGQGHSDLEVVHCATQPAATVHRVVEVAHVDGPDCDADHTDHLEGAPVLLLSRPQTLDHLMH